MRAVAEEIAADPRYEGDEHLGPDEDARARFKEFAKKAARNRVKRRPEGA